MKHTEIIFNFVFFLMCFLVHFLVIFHLSSRPVLFFLLSLSFVILFLLLHFLILFIAQVRNFESQHLSQMVNLISSQVR